MYFFSFPKVLALCLTVIGAAAETRPSLQLVVYTGDRSPIPGATSFFSLSIPTANERGAFLFSASNPQANQSFKPALFVSDGSSITPVVTHLNLYQHYTNIYFNAASTLDYSEFRINDAGTVLFQHEMTGYQFAFPQQGSWPVGVPRGSALWESSGGSPLPIAAERGSSNEFAPPGITLTSGVAPRIDRFPVPRMNNNGFYLFPAPIYGGNVSHGWALYSGQGSSLSLINWTGKTNGPQFSLGARLARDVNVGYFTATEAGSPANANNSFYRFAGGGSVERMIGPGEPLPGRPEGVESIELWDVDELGNALIGGRAHSSYGLWEVSGFGLRQVIPFNKEIQTPEGPLKIHSLAKAPSASVTLPRHSGGWTAFSALYTGFGATNGFGLFKVDAEGKIRLVFADGAPVPGTSFKFINNQPVDVELAFNAQGMTAFKARYRAPNDTADKTGLWLEDPLGVPHLVLSVGETVYLPRTNDIFTPLGHTVDTIWFDPETALTDSGICIFRVGFREGGRFSAGIYRAFAPGASELQGYIRGEVVSAQPTSTPEEYAVHRATVTVYEQPAGRIRARNANETDAAYDLFVKSRLGRALKKLQIRRSAEGGFFIPGLNALKPAGQGPLRNAFYTLEVTDAETLEWGVDEKGDLDKTRFVPLNFLPKRLLNLAIPTVDAHVALQPLDEIGIKQNLADNLRAVAPQNWTTIENQVDAFLEQLRNNPSSFTPARREALWRAIWAERAFVQAADFSDEMLKNALQSLGALLADAIGEILKAESAAMKGAKKRVQTAEEIRASPEFKTGSLNNELAGAASGADYSLVFNAELAGVLSNTLKASKPFIKAALLEIGLDPAQAEKVANILVLIERSILNALKDGGMNNFDRGLQGLSLLLQEIVKASINEARPILFDSDPALNISFATDVAPTLQNAVELMKNWNTYDETTFSSDRSAFLQRLDEYIYFQEHMLYATYSAQAAGEGFSSVEAGAATLGTVFKWVKVVEKVSKVLKYVGNIEGVVIPLGAVYKHTPDELDALTRLIYHQPAPLNAQSVPAITPLAQTGAGQALAASVPASGPAVLSIGNVRTALRSNEIGMAIQMSVAQPPAASLAVTYAGWKRDYQRFEAAAIALAAGTTNKALAYELAAAQKLRSNLRAEEARAGAGLGELFAGVLSGTFPSPSSPSYLAARADALAALDRLEGSLAGMSAQVAAVSNAVARAGGAIPIPVLVLESGSITSGGSVVRTITEDSQNFNLRMTAFNAGGSALPALRVELKTWGLGGRVTVTSPVKTLPLLQPGAEATLDWTFASSGAATGGAVALSADLAAVETAPTNLLVLGAEWILPVDTILADKDLDGLPDSYETANGLNLLLDDASADRDNDGLTNQQEFELGTNPRIADTDEDGLNDYAEISRSDHTNPLIADSDEDGASDGLDGAPLDPNSKTSAPAKALPVLAIDKQRVVLTPGSPSAAIPVTNTGGGYLLLAAESENPGLFSASPTEPILTTGGTVRLTAPHPFPALDGQSFLQSTATIRNLSSGIPQFEEVQVILSLGHAAITIRRVGNNAVICWPKDNSNYFLEQTSVIGPGKLWSSVPTVVQDAGGELCLTLPIDGTTRFYRLRRP